ncbi:ligand-binding sensor domain-containing protein [Catalinimonas alkaloidigena]|uniref:histidine kinase n=2 Tax=Catalinimonas alkaloidigena TaxID=1075417 RepID=A0A1G8X7T2_9BACT|nr:ligand-binding sensor domain-containing protein [Catalinimonas alkaloidigena]
MWLPLAVAGQEHRLSFRHLTTTQGIPHDYVTSVLQDRKGYIWIGTKDGLCRYDGSTVEVFRHDPDDSTSLSSNYIQSLLEDRDGNLWIGTYDSGLNRFDPRTGTARHYRHDPAQPGSLGGNNVVSLFEDREGTLWIGTYGGGLSQFVPEQQRFVSYANGQGGLETNTVFSICQDREGSLWLGTFGSGLYHFNPHVSPATFRPFRRDSMLATSDVFVVHEDQAGNLWAGTYGQGLFRISARRNTVTRFQHQSQQPGSLSNDYVLSVTEDLYGNLWLATRGGGLNHLNRETGLFHAYQHDPTDPTSLRDNKLNQLYLDPSGLLWVATESGGVSRFETQSTIFTVFPTQQQGFQAGSVVSCYEDERDQLWIGTFGDGLYRYQRKTQQFQSFRYDPNQTRSLNEDYVTALAEDRNGNLWVGTADEGLAQLQADGTFQRVYHQPDDSTSLASNAIETLYRDRRGQLWVGTYGGGLSRLRGQERGRYRFQNYQHHPDDAGSLPGNTVKVLYEDRMGRLWVGTREAGLARYDAGRDAFVTYKHQPGDVHSLPGNTVTAVAEDVRGRIWVGTLDGGLCMFEANRNRFRRVNDAQLPDEIRSMVADQAGNLWLTTAAGLSRFDPATSQFRHFTTIDGLYNHEFVQWAASAGQNGRLYFGGNDHLLMAEPQKLFPKEWVPPLYLRSFSLLGEKQQLAQPLDETAQIELRHDDNFFTLEFAFLNYLDPENNRYQYWMEGFDKKWVDSENRRQAPYTNLDAGQYVFHVRATDRNGVWNEQKTSIRILIHPAWWERLWFRIALGLVLVGSVLLYYRQRIRGMQRQKLALEALVEERTAQLRQRTEEIERQKHKIEEKNIHLLQAKSIIEDQNMRLLSVNDELESRVAERTRDLQRVNEELRRSGQQFDTFVYRASHDIRGPVARILGLCKVAALDVEDAKALDYIRMLDDACELANVTLNRVLFIYQMRNLQVVPETIELRQTLESIRYSLASVPGYTEVEFEWSGLSTIPVYTDEKMLETLFANLFENALRYRRPEAPVCQVKITITLQEGQVRVRVADNGMGISEEQRPRLFTMFYRGSTASQGTGLGLFLARMAVEKIGGTVEFLPIENWTMFEVQFPQHLDVESATDDETASVPSSKDIKTY